MKQLSPESLCAIVTLLVLPSYGVAMPTVSGDRLTWTDDGWHQVQHADTYETICAGNASEMSSLSGGPCIIDSGKYIVINHATGERFENISVSNSTSSTGDEGRLECTNSDRWHTDIYDRYTFGSVILPERSIIIP